MCAEGANLYSTDSLLVVLYIAVSERKFYNCNKSKQKTSEGKKTYVLCWGVSSVRSGFKHSLVTTAMRCRSDLISVHLFSPVPSKCKIISRWEHFSAKATNLLHFIVLSHPECSAFIRFMLIATACKTSHLLI